MRSRASCAGHAYPLRRSTALCDREGAIVPNPFFLARRYRLCMLLYEVPIGGSIRFVQGRPIVADIRSFPEPVSPNVLNCSPSLAYSRQKHDSL